ncbi:F-box only protein 42 [Mortierella claussenii]|nr:F-box only protein 42 [Mortierella claussenii]
MADDREEECEEQGLELLGEREEVERNIFESINNHCSRNHNTLGIVSDKYAIHPNDNNKHSDNNQNNNIINCNNTSIINTFRHYSNNNENKNNRKYTGEDQTAGKDISYVAEAAISPTWRAFHGAAIVDTSMIVFGGTTDASKNPYGATVPGSNDLWVWSTTLRQWSQPMTTASPSPQKFLSSISLQSQGRMMSLVSNATSPANALLMFDTYFDVWTIPSSPNPAVAPPLRLGAAVGTSDSLVFVHGGAAAGPNGMATSGVLNDLTKLDESTFQWTSIANGPSLMYHTMCRLTGLNMMIIFGGSDQANAAFNTVHTFDLNLETWKLAVPVSPGSGGTIPSARKGHTAVCLNNTMIVYGGGPDGPQDDDVWVLDASQATWVWNRITTNKQMGPGPRTGHSALINGTNMLVWGGYGTPLPSDVNIYILDTVAWQWTSSKDLGPAAPVPVVPPATEPETKGSNLPLTLGVVCGSLALITAFIGFLLFRRRASKRKENVTRDSQGTASFLADTELSTARDHIVEDKPSFRSSLDKATTSSTDKRSQKAAARRSMPSFEYPMQSMAAFAAAEQDSHRAESSRSSEQYRQPLTGSQKGTDPTTTTGSVGARVGSIASDPFYPAYLAEDDEEDADRWTFASSLSFDQRDNNHSLPTLRYIPARVHGTAGTQRSLGHSTGSLGGTSSQRIPMMIHPHGGSRTSRRDPSSLSVRTGNGSSIGPGSVSLTAAVATATSTEVLNREGSNSPRDTTLFNSVSPLDRVTLMCSGIDMGRPSEDDALLMNCRHSGSVQLYSQDDDANTTDQSQAQQQQQQQQQSDISSEVVQTDLRRKDTTSTSTTKSSTTYTTLDNPALVALVQNLPARYKLSKSPSPIHGESNDILFAIDSDTHQPIVIKSFTRKEAWERECRVLRRLKGPNIVELKHVATLVLSETDDPNEPAKIRLTILERLDETLAQMLKNARKAKKVALREQSQQPNEALDLAGAGLYKSGPALDEGYIKDIAKGILRCLSWCHSKKIVYCDLKPSNVMHNRDDPRQQWKLIDMESSRVASEECIGIGTVRYCPPEVARGTTVDKQASLGVTANYSIDLWAFGCLIYELFATRPLFPLSLSDDTVLHFLAHPSPDTPSLANGLRWNSQRELEVPHFELAVPNESARALIRILLHPDPLLRATMSQALASDYLSIPPESRRSRESSTSVNERQSGSSGSQAAVASSSGPQQVALQPVVYEEMPSHQHDSQGQGPNSLKHPQSTSSSSARRERHPQLYAENRPHPQIGSPQEHSYPTYGSQQPE